MEADKNIEDTTEPILDAISDSFFFQVIRMRKAIFRRSSQLLNEAGIYLKIEQTSLIVILKKYEILSQRELSDITLRDKSSILRSISALQKKGLVAVEQDHTDKRKNNISLTAAGLILAKNIRSLLHKAEDDVLSVFSAEERKTAFQTVKNYADKLEKI